MIPIREYYAPKIIKEALDKAVIGQDYAKTVLSVALYNHLKRINYGPALAKEGIELAKSNILMLGPSGSGKTHLIRNLAKICGLPCVIVDGTSFTESGCKGNDYSDILVRLYAEANGDIKLAERGIVFIDEIDKKARSSSEGTSTKLNEADQQGILKFIEGTTVDVDPDPNDNSMPIATIKTDNILFILGGAFVGIEKIIAKRLEVKAPPRPTAFGLTSYSSKKSTKSYNELMQNILPEDICKYGLIPELVGRVPIICTLKELDCNDLCKILKEPKNNLISQYKEIFKFDNIELDIEDEAIKAIAEKAISCGTGARGLKGILDGIMNNIMFTRIESTNHLPQKIKVSRTSVTTGEFEVIA